MVWKSLFSVWVKSVKARFYIKLFLTNNKKLLLNKDGTLNIWTEHHVTVYWYSVWNTRRFTLVSTPVNYGPNPWMVPKLQTTYHRLMLNWYSLSYYDYSLLFPQWQLLCKSRVHLFIAMLVVTLVTSVIPMVVLCVNVSHLRVSILIEYGTHACYNHASKCINIILYMYACVFKSHE